MSVNTTNPQVAPPTYELPIPIERGSQMAMLASSGICIFLPIALVTLRFVAGRRVSRGFDASSFCILAALVRAALNEPDHASVLTDTALRYHQFFNTALHIDCWVMVFNGAFGFHVTGILASGVTVQYKLLRYLD
ncbi:hypothetical protein GGTG_02578 [Gaeumannomyces tritici R3-111a-1]|uniref:Uncharacterized protein n=1 Tax=Gaeumannomyces tritici (strain R3-111a-1) TaxID=644352 RepID=J3NMS2_GAET3|nr:hypothetical protein GGTG_02578 [Gaeumannomyces tritici R3-111a-1]EJT82605.1 hypothetical protein GGTG_02578 [Gaeumannomyces tritici R3-111a-1]